MKKFLKLIFHIKTPKFKGDIRCLHCGGRANGCCPINKVKD